MKKKIIFGVIFSISIILLVNTTSAVEYKNVEDYNIELLQSQLNNINGYIFNIVQKLNNNINSISKISRNEIKELFNQLIDLEISIFEDTALPNFIIRILSFIISLIFSILGTIVGIIFGKIFGPLLVLFVKLLTAPIVLFAKIIAFIVDLLNP